MVEFAIVQIDGLVGVLALSLPIFALFTIIALALRRPHRKTPAGDAPPNAIGRDGDDAGTPPASAKSTSAPVENGKAEEQISPRVVGRANRRYAARTEPKWPNQPSPSYTDAPLGADALAAAIADAEAKNEQVELPRLYLALAGHAQTSGNLAEAADLLRKSIRICVAAGRHEEHAKARLELGDIAGTNGDLTTACEHWQIARRLYHEMSRKTELSAAESRMRDNGCPTDWVLNDF